MPYGPGRRGGPAQRKLKRLEGGVSARERVWRRRRSVGGEEKDGSPATLLEPSGGIRPRFSFLTRQLEPARSDSEIWLQRVPPVVLTSVREGRRFHYIGLSELPSMGHS